MDFREGAARPGTLPILGSGSYRLPARRLPGLRYGPTGVPSGPPFVPSGTADVRGGRPGDGQLSALGLVLNSVTSGNTVYLDKL